MTEQRIEVAFGGGFMYVFEGDQNGGHWASLTAGTVQASAGVGPHGLILVCCEGSVDGDLQSTTHDNHTAWELDGCQVEMDPESTEARVLAPLDIDAAPPKSDTPSPAWRNWKWVLDPVALHTRLGQNVSPLRHGWPDRLRARVLITSGTIAPEGGFPSVDLSVGSRTETLPISTETLWSSHAPALALRVTGAREGRLVFTPVNDRLRLTFLHFEPADAVLPQLRDLAMIYELIDVPESQRIVSGVINETVTAATGDVRLLTPRKTCASARFVADWSPSASSLPVRGPL